MDTQCLRRVEVDREGIAGRRESPVHRDSGGVGELDRPRNVVDTVTKVVDAFAELVDKGSSCARAAVASFAVRSWAAGGFAVPVRRLIESPAPRSTTPSYVLPR